MAKKLFPSLTSSVPFKADKASRQNMDNVFNALINLVTQNGFEHGTQLASVLTITYNRIQVLFHEDPRYCLKTIKLLRKWIVERLRGHFEENPGLHSWEWDFKRNSPIILSDFLDFIVGQEKWSKHDRLFVWRIFIALFSLDRVMMLPAEPSYSTITEPGVSIDTKSDFYPKKIASLVRNLGFTAQEFREQYKKQCNKFEYEVLCSAGVNGNATWTAHSDAKAWLSSPLVSEFKKMADLSGLGHIFKDMLSCVSIATEDKTIHADLRLGRLHSFDEWGGKVRTVAIVDYWTQMLMTPLHNTINHFLKGLDTDGTFDQAKVANNVKAWTCQTDVPVYSFDLTAATDRLPLSLQIDILGTLLGSTELAKAWGNILVGRDYYTESGTSYKYTVGQPMGARSSFAMLALTHHIIVQHAFTLSKDEKGKSYCVLGDDMTICGLGSAEAYRNIMGLLGVPINLSKSIISHENAAPAGEICKRIFIEGEEITNIPVKLIAKTIKEGSLAPILQSEMQNKGWNFSEDGFTYFFYGLLNETHFTDLVTLNLLPKESAGLPQPIKVSSSEYSDFSKWYPGFDKFNPEIINNVFTWTAAVESLKRLDFLLRNTLAIGTAISEKFNLYTESVVNVKTLWEILGIPTSVPTSVVESLIKDIDKLEPSHPIVKASEAEIKRITEIMAGLINHDTNVYNKSRDGLLDMVRNALSDIWTDTEAAKAAGIRTLTTKGLANLNTMVTKGLNIKDEKGVLVTDPSMMVLDYNLTLTTIGRSWSVRVGADFKVTVNAVKSRVRTHVKSSDMKIKSIISGIKLTRRDNNKSS